ncbi:hypothetical protein ACH43Y_32125 [Streptomyces rubiginosohelvolus]|uniref:hypothetical protein n=1 Tax=Streptomyces TaxID=1883 RepID=UPI00099C9392|nr:hypothetical protein [Streptomyces sp. JS01]
MAAERRRFLAIILRAALLGLALGRTPRCPDALDDPLHRRDDDVVEITVMDVEMTADRATVPSMLIVLLPGAAVTPWGREYYVMAGSASIRNGVLTCGFV